MCSLSGVLPLLCPVLSSLAGAWHEVLECELELLLEMLRGSEFGRRVGSRLLEIASWEELVGGCTTADADDAACEPLANSTPPETGR